MQIPFFEGRNIFPCRATEFGFPVCRYLIRCAVLENVIVLVFFIPGNRLLKPLVAGGSMVEHHIEHQLDPPVLCLADQLFQIFHRSKHRVYLPVICHIITVIVLRGHEERSNPQIVHSQRLQIIKLLRNAPDVSDPVSVGIFEGS